MLVKRINATRAGWVNYFRVGNASPAFSAVRDYVEMKVRTLLTRRKRRPKSSVGWGRWSNEYRQQQRLQAPQQIGGQPRLAPDPAGACLPAANSLCSGDERVYHVAAGGANRKFRLSNYTDSRNQL